MAQQTSTSHALSADLDAHVIPFPARYAPYVPAELPASLSPTATQMRVRRNVTRHVVVLEVFGQLSDVVVELDRAIQLALAHGPRGVICDLSGVLKGVEPAALEILATAGHHVRDWPGIPVAVACPDQRVRELLGAHPLGGHLITAESLPSAIDAVLATPYLMVQCLRLAAHPTAPRAARDFVTRTLLDWRLSRVIPFASLVVGELVASSSIHAGTNIDLSVVWDRGGLRLTVADHGPALSGQQNSGSELHGRGLTVVAGLSRSFGVLPTDDGGTVVWAVLEAPRPPPLINDEMSRAKSEPKPVKKDSVVQAI
jgi:anti-sigma regulatory factor (Ser/Thr protein kinase)